MYGLTSNGLKSLFFKLKNNHDNYEFSKLKATEPCNSEAISDLSNRVSSMGDHLSAYNRSNLELSVDPMYLRCASWMEFYFNLVGDKMPNLKGNK